MATATGKRPIAELASDETLDDPDAESGAEIVYVMPPPRHTAISSRNSAYMITDRLDHALLSDEASFASNPANRQWFNLARSQMGQMGRNCCPR